MDLVRIDEDSTYHYIYVQVSNELVKAYQFQINESGKEFIVMQNDPANQTDFLVSLSGANYYVRKQLTGNLMPLPETFIKFFNEQKAEDYIVVANKHPLFIGILNPNLEIKYVKGYIMNVANIYIDVSGATVNNLPRNKVRFANYDNTNLQLFVNNVCKITGNHGTIVEVKKGIPSPDNFQMFNNNILYSKVFTTSPLDLIPKSVNVNPVDTIIICPFSHSDEVQSLIHYIHSVKGKKISDEKCSFFNGVENLCSGEFYIYITNEGGLKVCGYLIALHYPVHVEVYDVYTFYEFRSAQKGMFPRAVASKLLEAVKFNTFQDLLWLGVLYTNPHFDIAVRSYVKNGFSIANPGATQTYAGLDLGNDFLGLLCDKREPVTGNYMERYKAIMSSVSDWKQKCDKYEYTFSHETLQFLYSLLGKPHESGGHLIADKDNVITLINCKENESHYKGDDNHVEYKYTTEFMYHTHPRICYTINQCALGWPSGGDMLFALTEFKRVRVNIVSTCEGIYVFQLSTEMQHFLYKLEEIFAEINLSGQPIKVTNASGQVHTYNPYSVLINALAKIIEDRFNKSEQYRKEKDAYVSILSDKVKEVFLELGTLASNLTTNLTTDMELTTENLYSKCSQCIDQKTGCFCTEQQAHKYIQKIDEYKRLSHEYNELTNQEKPITDETYCNWRKDQYLKYVQEYTIMNALNELMTTHAFLLEKVKDYMMSYIDIKTRRDIQVREEFLDFFDKVLLPDIKVYATAILDGILSGSSTQQYNIAEKISEKITEITKKITSLSDILLKPVFDVQQLSWKKKEGSCTICVSCDGTSSSTVSTSSLVDESLQATPKTRMTRRRVTKQAKQSTSGNAGPSVKAGPSADACSHVSLEINSFKVNKCLYITQDAVLPGDIGTAQGKLCGIIGQPINP